MDMLDLTLDLVATVVLTAVLLGGMTGLVFRVIALVFEGKEK
jgi:hypothetical protein